MVLMKNIVGLITVPAWILGIIIAKGFWSTFFAVIVPLWAWYLAGEHVFTKFGII